jgi:hypothetical protein
MSVVVISIAVPPRNGKEIYGKPGFEFWLGDSLLPRQDGVKKISRRAPLQTQKSHVQNERKKLSSTQLLVLLLCPASGAESPMSANSSVTG